jgi:hypothetical protein
MHYALKRTATAARFSDDVLEVVTDEDGRLAVLTEADVVRAADEYDAAAAEAGIETAEGRLVRDAIGCSDRRTLRALAADHAVAPTNLPDGFLDGPVAVHFPKPTPARARSSCVVRSPRIAARRRHAGRRRRGPPRPSPSDAEPPLAQAGA